MQTPTTLECTVLFVGLEFGPYPRHRRKRRLAQTVICDLLSRNPDGLPGSVLVDLLMHNGSRSRQTASSTLNHLRKRNCIARVNGLWRLKET